MYFGFTFFGRILIYFNFLKFNKQNPISFVFIVKIDIVFNKMDETYLKEQLDAKENMLAQTTRFLVQIQEDLEKKNEALNRANKDIFDSISFATLIQNSLLPDVEILKIFFKNAAFKVMQQIGIGGDSVFVKNTNDGIVFGLLDATGHGIPASLLSISGTLLLKELMTSMEINDPQNLLNLLNNQLYNTFNNKNKSIAHKEGAIFSYSSRNKTLQYSSAKGKACVIKNSGEIEDLPFSKKSVGDEANTEFELFNLEINSGEKILLYSDGLIDQFGGGNDKKFSRKRLKKFLIDNSTTSTSQLSSLLEDKFHSWKGENTQTDDASYLIIEI